MARFRLGVLLSLAVLALGAAAYGGYWLTVAARLERGIFDWVEQARANGYEVAYDTIEVGGFPFTFTIAISAPRIERPRGPLPWSWRSRALKVVLPPFRLAAVHAETSEGQELVIHHAGDDAIAIRSRRARVETELRDDAPVRVILDMVGITSERNRWPTIVRADIRAQHGGADRTSIALDLDQVTLPLAAVSPLGAKIERLALGLVLQGSLPDAPFPEAVEAWRANGGTIEVERFDLAWNGVTLGLRGTLALDQALRPLASFEGAVQGFDTAVDAIGAAQHLSAGQMLALKVGVRLLGKKNGSTDAVDVSGSIQGGRVYIGAIPIARVGPLIGP